MFCKFLSWVNSICNLPFFFKMFSFRNSKSDNLTLLWQETNLLKLFFQQYLIRISAINSVLERNPQSVLYLIPGPRKNAAPSDEQANTKQYFENESWSFNLWPSCTGPVNISLVWSDREYNSRIIRTFIQLSISPAVSQPESLKRFWESGQITPPRPRKVFASKVLCNCQGRTGSKTLAGSFARSNVLYQANSIMGGGDAMASIGGKMLREKRSDIF